ncbi:hypothetical protein ASPVEDRAFT_502290 [Aspergillus versicolor CBS 583.65]|uniref:GrpB domain protein n=1 Tax=Aspergillus versicolor CBS 583.65 TaxID=1036611 RepID=A0A1L9PC78_ASPVE|nr:uncharacterized protein ASPVEDRAFT_502290 [Aspergillus versicolor CBS 583.65]OJI99139.1 hypothetical protein ASPVEDRAFT_502290 [Aspergillus versicolor CBS 583.65]
MKVAIEPYDPTWPLKFSEIQAELSDILRSVDIISIEHVGSTTIPSLMAKPVLDIDIIIPNSPLEAARSALKDANYTDCGEMNVPGRFAFRQPGYGKLDAAHGKGRNGELRYNTYLMIQGCVALRNHLDAKRVLLDSQELREEYARVKTKLKETEFENIGEYASGKTDILCKILRTAGWSEEDLNPVIKANS